MPASPATFIPTPEATVIALNIYNAMDLGFTPVAELAEATGYSVEAVTFSLVEAQRQGRALVIRSETAGLLAARRS